MVGGTLQKEARGREVSLLICLDRRRAHESAKETPSTGVETLDDDDSYNVDVVSVGHQNPPRAAKLNDRGSEPKITGGTPHKKVQGGDVLLLFHLDCKRRTQLLQDINKGEVFCILTILL
jgi:hypothetical protein